MSELQWPEPTGWPADAQRHRLMGEWFLYQRTGGHRTSTDDVLTAWFASTRVPNRPARYLDLGCGIGSVLLMTAHRLRPDHSTGVEAQAQSAQMARRTVAELPAGAPPIEIVHADMRDLAPALPRFDLVTGSPPYFPLGTGSLPPDPQRRACRFEARGGVEAYCAAAAAHLAERGRFYLVYQTRFDARVQSAAATAALHVSTCVEVRMREDRGAPFLTVYEMEHAGDEGAGRLEDVEEFAIRDAQGRITPRYAAARRALGVGSGADETPAG